MNRTVVYQCSRCGQVYTPQQANQAAFTCHGRPLRRVNAPAAPAIAVQSGGGVGYSAGGAEWAVRRVLPPPDNMKDAAAVEHLFGSLHGSPGPLSLELAGDARQRQMLVRGTPAVVEHVVHQLQGDYGQVSWEDPGDDDPALGLVGAEGAHVVQRRVKLRRPLYFPIKTWREFEEADPLQVLLGAFRGLGEGESLLSQLVLVRPAPDDWADAYQGSAQQRDFRMQAASASGQARSGLFAAGIVLGFVDVTLLCALTAAFFRPGLGVLDVLKALAGLGLLAAANVGLAVPALRAWRVLTTRLNANPMVVQRKVSLPAFECELRLWAAAPSEARALALVERLASAYRLFNLAEGNALVAAGGAQDFAPALPALSGVEGSEVEGPPHALSSPSAASPPSKDGRLVLNLAELAGLWHMPVGDTLELVRREAFVRLLPLPEDVSGPDGVHVGFSIKDDQRVPVSLSADAVRRNTLLIGKTQMGKSNVMELLAHAAMWRRQAALVALDPQGDMVRHLRGLVPPDRVHETFYVDFADAGRCVGLNLLDMSLGLSVDKVVSDLIALGEALWAEYWGPRMEAVWRYATRTLALINLQRVGRGQPEQQYTILDVPPLLLAPRDRRTPFLMANLPLDTPEGQDVLWWWSQWYEPLRTSLQQDVVSPVLSKVFRISGNDLSRSVFGQAVSTLNMREVLRRGGNLLVHTAAGEVGEEIGGFMGAVVLNLLNTVIRERAAESRASRLPCLAIVDEFQSIPAVDYGALLSELQKFEVAFVLGTQSLARLRVIQRELPGIVFAGVATTMAFQTNYEDAEYVSGELDEVPPGSMVNLTRFNAYVKTTNAKGARIPVYSMETVAPLAPDPSVAYRVEEQVSGYSRLAADVREQVSRLALEMRDDAQARRHEEQLTTMLQAQQESAFVSEQQLTDLAAMMATRSTQDYGPAAGSVGRGQPARRRGGRRSRSGFRVKVQEE